MQGYLLTYLLARAHEETHLKCLPHGTYKPIPGTTELYHLPLNVLAHPQGLGCALVVLK